MTQFEYLSVMISIILALGISECLACWARLLRHRDVVRFYWVHIAWTVVALLVLIELWWGFWQYSTMAHWSYFGLLGVVAECALPVVAILVITPARDEPLSIDLRAFYFAHSRLFFSLVGAALVLLMLVDVIVGEQPLWHAENAVRPLGVLLCAALAVWRRAEKLHAGAVLLGVALFVAFVAAVGGL